MARWYVGWVMLLSGAGCGPQVVSGEGGGSDTSGAAVDTTGAPATTSVGTSVGTTGSTSSGSDPTTSSATTEGTDTDRLFLVPPDVPYGDECNIFDQDCPEGQKCMPWANDGGVSWNATRCSDVVEDPRAIGESCTVVGSGVSGIDDCTFGAMCFFVDGASGIGQCVGFCTGTIDAPTCGDPCTPCTLNGDATLALCLTGCDPLAPDCSAGQGCYPSGTGFTCISDQSMDAGAAGDPCAFINDCDPGLVCMSPDQVPGCVGDGCCAPVCDTSLPDACDAALPGTTCVPWDDPVPDGCELAILGVCRS